MNLTATIESAELQFKQNIEAFFQDVYDERSLYSHGIEHHRRVWNYARQLFILLYESNLTGDGTLPFKLIIVSYLHDIGMSVDHGERHGHHSRDLCIRFLEKNHLEESYHRDVLTAIENHDNKEYKTFAGKYDLLTILSVADDLDAFGFTGIYRYLEIYLTRAINPSEIGKLVLENARGRFENFTKTFGFSDELFQKHKKRYQILIDFFAEYNNQVSSYQFGSHEPSGYCGVIEIIKDAVKRQINFQSILNEQLQNSPDQIFRWFIKGVKSDSLNCP